MGIYVGFDIGGTKCAAVTGIEKDGELTILGREAFATPADQQEALDRLCALAEKLAGGQEILGIGISSGGPMDADKGELCNPPNLPGWHGISLTDYAQQKLHAPALLENDANACALAEWRWGAGKGSKVMMFLTFGTGLGAGIVIGGRVLRGANGNAGELGHWRLAETGPAGYGKVGAFEGFCSGGGIAQLAQSIGTAWAQRGQKPTWLSDRVTAKDVAQAAFAGDPAAQEVFDTSARFLGKGLALAVDFSQPGLHCDRLGLRAQRSALPEGIAPRVGSGRTRRVACGLPHRSGHAGRFHRRLRRALPRRSGRGRAGLTA